MSWSLISFYVNSLAMGLRSIQQTKDPLRDEVVCKSESTPPKQSTIINGFYHCNLGKACLTGEESENVSSRQARRMITRVIFSNPIIIGIA